MRNNPSFAQGYGQSHEVIQKVKYLMRSNQMSAQPGNDRIKRDEIILYPNGDN